MNYYNEFNTEAAAWLRQLIEENLIPAGIVDTRSICDVTPADLKGFNQCHFFAGIGGWPLALQRAGVSPNTELWTGSCPCQPFSSAGRQEGVEDARHLWPVFASLIRECRPPVVLGEQVDSAIGHGWLDGVCADLEAEGYAVGAAVLPACGINAPHRRNRLWWAGVLADEHSQQRNGFRKLPAGNAEPANGGDACRVADTIGAGECRGDERGSNSRGKQVGELQDGQGAANESCDGCEAVGAVADTANSIGGRGISGAEAGTGPDGERRRGSSGGSDIGRMVNGIQPGLEGHDRDGAGSGEPGRLATDSTGSTAQAVRVGSVGNAESRGQWTRGEHSGSNDERSGDQAAIGGICGTIPEEYGAVGRMVNAESGGAGRIMGSEVSANGSSCGGGEDEGMRGHEQSPAGHVAVHCADGKYRRVPTESLFQRVDDGLSLDMDRMRNPSNGYPLCEKKAVPHRRQLLHGYGNAIHPDIAAAWVRAVMMT